MPVWLSPWAWTATDWAGVQCVVLVIAAIIALRQVREARRLREAQVQPFALKRRLSDDTVLDLGVFRNVLHPIRQDVHDVHARLKELVAETKKLREALPPAD
jgi:hypothetical protein